MTYLIGVILVLLLIGLVLVFRPPKQKPYQDPSHPESEADAAKEVAEESEPGIWSEGETAVAVEEELDLTFDDTVSAGTAWTGGQSEAEEELDLILDEEGDGVGQQEIAAGGQPPATASGSETPAESLSVTEAPGSDEYDEDIPFIDEGEETSERNRDMDVAPALADVPDDYAQLVEDETPDELAERLEYFLGTDEDEPELEELDVEHDDDRAEVEEKAEAGDEAVEAAPVEIGPEEYSADLQKQEERLRRDIQAAIQDRETGKLALLGTALENLCIQQGDIRTSFEQHQQLLAELESVLTEVQQALPGFQLETVRASLQKGELEVVRTLLIDAANQLDGSPLLASSILYRWGRIEEEQGQLAAALEMYVKAQSGDEDNPDYLYAAGRLARITGDTDNAMSWLEKRVKTGQENGEENIELARAEHELARVLVMAEENDRAETLLLSGREKMEQLLGTGHEDLGPVLHDLAALYESSARYEQAEPLYKKALEITEQRFGRDYPRLGTTLNKLAGLYEEIEMEEKSEPLYSRALEIRQKVLGDTHPDVGAIMGHLANLLKAKGKYDQAEPMYRKSLEIAEVALGKDHPNLAVVLNDMAELYSAMGNEAQAEYFQERAFSLFGLPGMGDGFVEMDKDTDYEVDDDKDQTVAGS